MKTVAAHPQAAEEMGNGGKETDLSQSEAVCLLTSQTAGQMEWMPGGGGGRNGREIGYAKQCKLLRTMRARILCDTESSIASFL